MVASRRTGHWQCAAITSAQQLRLPTRYALLDQNFLHEQQNTCNESCWNSDDVWGTRVVEGTRAR
jgi:hypothetical protein